MSKFKAYTPEQLENLFSNYLISSWSYSKITSFARNEKAFEMNSIFGVYSKNSATTVAGQAYHKALDYFFTTLKDGTILNLVELEQAAFMHIDEMPANQWKIQTTTPDIESCVQKATKTVTQLLKNFMFELSLYTDDIDEILDVEVYGDEFLTVNGVDVPLPCHFRIDLVFRSKAGKIVIVDHKSKATYTDDEEIALSIGVQAITYILGYESKTGRHVDEVWFVENKYSVNKNGDKQLQAFKLSIDNDTRKLYEALLYEPLKRTLDAVSDPDYIYLINESDNYTDKAEVYDFWARTLIMEVEDFNVEETKKNLVRTRLRKIRDASIATISPKVIRNFKENAASYIQYDLSKTNMTNEEKIEHCLRTQGISASVAHNFIGFSSDTYLLEVGAGTKISTIQNKGLDLAYALDVSNVRISRNLVMFENKSYLAIDFTKSPENRLKLMFDPSDLQDLKIPLGKDNFGNIIFWDLANQSTPHALICGGTGSGKSVEVITIIEYAILTGQIEIVIFDPKFEFLHYAAQGIEVLNEISDIETYMELLVENMNSRVRRGQTKLTLIIFDEFADAVANAAGKLEENLRLILQKGRSSGFRICAVTQRADVNVISGNAKVNLTVQICFKVQKKVDSVVVLDEPGAEQLGGKGDGLIKSPDYGETVRFQAYYKPQN